MNEYILPLTREEGLDGNNKGWGFAKANRNRWINITNMGKTEWHDTYERSVTHFVYQDKVYHIHQDFIILDENVRLFIITQSRNQADYENYKY